MLQKDTLNCQYNFFSEDVIEEVVVKTMEQVPMQLVQTLVIVHRNDSNIKYRIFGQKFEQNVLKYHQSYRWN